VIVRSNVIDEWRTDRKEQAMKHRSPIDEPYKSALDLPSVAEMLQHIRGGKILTRLIARRVRPDLLRIENEIKRLARLVDRFYEVLGHRHWIFHEHLSTERIGALLDLPTEEAERRLIDLYKEPETLDFLIRMLRRFPEMRVRMHLIEHARTDYLEGRYYATILALLPTMDGFVNALDSQHRGLHTRSEDEMHAWDSVVGHHLGLTNAHKTFTKSFSKTSDEEVTELYRNGILHGNLVNFDNDVVASKAWNRLFAVADWATSQQKLAKPPEPKPTMRELMLRIRENEEAKEALARWRPRALSAEEPGFAEDEVHQATAAYLEAWRARNYGRMARSLSVLVSETSHSQTAGMVRETYDQVDLTDFAVRVIDYQAAAACEVDAELVLGGESRFAAIRWIREGEDGVAALPNQRGEWRLISWTPIAMLNRAHERKQARIRG
jgi:hypothetical protein